MTIRLCRDPGLVARLVPLATAEGFGFMERLVREWAGGVNRFARDGEVLLMVEVGGETVACGGITRQGGSVGRLRRVYVDPKFRRLGVGRALVETLVESAGESFEVLVLYTDNPSAGRFYERLGFIPEEPTSTPDGASHRLDGVAWVTGVGLSGVQTNDYSNG